MISLHLNRTTYYRLRGVAKQPEFAENRPINFEKFLRGYYPAQNTNQPPGLILPPKNRGKIRRVENATKRR